MVKKWVFSVCGFVLLPQQCRGIWRKCRTLDFHKEHVIKQRYLLYCISNFPALLQECRDIPGELFCALVLCCQFLLSSLVKIAVVCLHCCVPTPLGRWVLMAFPSAVCWPLSSPCLQGTQPSWPCFHQCPCSTQHGDVLQFWCCVGVKILQCKILQVWCWLISCN